MKRYLDQLAKEFSRRIFYGSVVGAVFVWLLVVSSAWQAASAAFAHADFAAAATISALRQAATGAKPSSRVVSLAITDEAYRERFRSQSPLDRGELLEIARQTLESTGSATLVVDLDVSPNVQFDRVAPEVRFDALDEFWIKNADRVVLAFPAKGVLPETLAWANALCQRNVRFGRAEVPEIFGLADFTHDVKSSIAGVASGGKPLACPIDPSPVTASDRLRVASSPNLVARPIVVEIGHKNDKTFIETLKGLTPAFVVLGGTWSEGDSFLTPFADRYGMHLHAAKIEGWLARRTVAPVFTQVLLAVVVAALVVVLAKSVACKLGCESGTQSFKLPNGNDATVSAPTCEVQDWRHSPNVSFMHGSFKRLAVVATVCLVLCVVFIVSAVVNAFFGIWFPTMILIGFSAVSTIAAWVTEITPMLQVERPIVLLVPVSKNGNSKADWHNEFIFPVVEIFKTIGVCTSVLAKDWQFRFSKRTGIQAPAKVACSSNGPGDNLRKVQFDLLFGILHLVGRVIVPAAAFIYLLSR